MEIRKYLPYAAVAAVSATIASITTYFTMLDDNIPRPKYRRVDIAAFKRSMSERYKHIEAVKLDEIAKAGLLKAIHANIDKDIHALFNEAEYTALIAHNEMLLAKHS